MRVFSTVRGSIVLSNKLYERRIAGIDHLRRDKESAMQWLSPLALGLGGVMMLIIALIPSCSDYAKRNNLVAPRREKES